MTTETTNPELAEQAKAAAGNAPASGEPSPFLERIKASLESTPEPEPEKEPEPQPEGEAEEPKETPSEEDDGKEKSPLEKAAAGEVDDEEEEEAEEPKMDPKAGAAFKKLKSQIKEHKAEIAKLRAETGTHKSQAEQLAAALAQTLGVDEVTPESIERRAKELAAKAAVVDLENTPEYQKAVVEPQKAIQRSLKRVVESYDLDEAKLADAMAEKNLRRQTELLEDLLGDMPARDQRVIHQAIDDMALVEAKRTELREQAGMALEQIQRDQQRIAEAQRMQMALEIDQNTRTHAEMLKQQFPDHAGKVEEFVGVVAEELKKGVTAEVQTYTAIAGMMLPTLKQELARRDRQIAELTKTVESYKKATPGARPGNSREAAIEPAKEGETFMERIERQLAGRQ